MDGLGKLRRGLGLERGDFTRAFPIIVAYALTLATVYILKPARNALFLHQVGVDQLPYVLMLVALTGGVFVAAYSRFSRLMRTDRLVQGTLLVMLVTLLGFRALLEFEARWVYFVFFIWVQLFGLVTTSLVWLWASSAFDPRHARRVFGLIGTGGIVGAIGGGLFTGTFAGGVGTSNLLYIAVGMVGLILLALSFAPGVTETPAARSDGSDTPADEDAARSLPRLLALNAGLIAFAAVFVDIQFNDIVDRHFSGAEAKAAFFGAFFAGVSGFSLVFQLVVTPWLLRRFGVGPALSVLPGALGLGSFVFMVSPVFPFATLPKAADGSFRHSVHKAASELLFLPIPDRTKQRTKLFIDTTVDTAATGLGALAIVFLTRGLDLAYGQLTFFTVTLILASLAVVPAIRRAYVDAFRRAIEGRQIDLSKLTVGLDEASVLDLLLPALRSDQPRQVIYALDLLSSARSTAVRDAVAPLLLHDEARVRMKALEVLGPAPATFAPDGRPRLLEDVDPQVRAAALEIWLESGDRAAEETLEAWLDAAEAGRAGPALSALRALPPERRRALLSEDRLDRLEPLAETEPEVAAPLAWALAATLTSRFNPRLRRCLERAGPGVLDRAIQGFAESADPAYVPWLLDRLEDRRTRASARRALAAFGVDAVAPVAKVVDASDRGIGARRAAVRALADIGDAEAVSALLERLRHGEPALAREVVDALARGRRLRPEQRFPRPEIRAAVRERIAEWRLILASERWLPEPKADASRLFARARAEKAERLRDEIFALLGLLRDPRAISDAAKRVADGAPSVRAKALEFLENALDPEVGRLLIPLLEVDDPETALHRTDPELGALPRSPGAILGIWSEVHDPWLRACSLYAAPEIDGSVDPAAWSKDGEPHPLVSEVLALAAPPRTA